MTGTADNKGVHEDGGGGQSTDRAGHAPHTPLYPDITPYSSGFFRADDIHALYWEQSGNPNGTPVVLLHGGPGAGALPVHRRFFDPLEYRIIIFDQRGAGRSRPLGELRNNTTDHLIADMEGLRHHLRIERWHVFGGSWGSTLAMAYAARFPERVISLVLRGIFTMAQDEINWFLYGMGTFFPEAAEQFSAHIPGDERADLLTAYYRRLTSPETSVQIDAAINWCLYEEACASLIPNYETITTQAQKDRARAMARIEAHYFMHESIPADKDLISTVPAFRHIPACIVQGRYDVICPIAKAHQLHAAWPEAEYIVVPDGGHSALDPAIRSRLVEATDSMRKLRK